jgi:carbon monoxide dehydrogenase subunit G
LNEISETFVIAAPVDEIWPLLADPILVASCIPGASLSAAEQQDVFHGTLTVKFGPTVVTFRGEAKINYDHSARRCTIEGRGLDQRGVSRAMASGSVAVTGEERTEVAVSGRYHLAGPLETFARTGGVHVARALIADFAANVTALANERRQDIQGHQRSGRPSASEQVRPPRQTGQHLSAAGLLWRAFLAWLRQWFRKA